MATLWTTAVVLAVLIGVLMYAIGRVRTRAGKTSTGTAATGGATPPAPATGAGGATTTTAAASYQVVGMAAGSIVVLVMIILFLTGTITIPNFYGWLGVTSVLLILIAIGLWGQVDKKWHSGLAALMLVALIAGGPTWWAKARQYWPTATEKAEEASPVQVGAGTTVILVRSGEVTRWHQLPRPGLFTGYKAAINVVEGRVKVETLSGEKWEDGPKEEVDYTPDPGNPQDYLVRFRSLGSRPAKVEILL